MDMKVEVCVVKQPTAPAETLLVTGEMAKMLELNALMNRRITPDQCKHLSSDEIVIATLQML